MGDHQRGLDLSIGVTTGLSIEKTLWFSSLAEKTNIHGIWVGEDIDRAHDVFTLTSLAILNTSNAKVGIGITSPLVHNISTIARASATLQEIAAGRFRLGLGVGGLRDLAKKHIEIDNPRRILLDAANLLRRVWLKEAVTYRGRFPLEDYSIRFAPSFGIPIYFGARGSKLLELAGEVADGVIVSGPRKYVESAVASVRRGIDKRKEQDRPFRIVAWLPTILIHKKEDMAMAKETVAIVAADTPQSIIEASKIESERTEKIREAVAKLGPRKASRYVTEELIEDFSICGNAGRIVQAFRSMTKHGVNEVVFGPPYGRSWREAAVELMKAWGGKD